MFQLDSGRKLYQQNGVALMTARVERDISVGFGSNVVSTKRDRGGDGEGRPV